MRGGSLGAFLGTVTLNSIEGQVAYILLPLVTMGTKVAYFFTRSRPPVDAGRIASELLSDLPDPKKTSAKRTDENEPTGD